MEISAVSTLTEGEWVHLCNFSCLFIVQLCSATFTGCETLTTDLHTLLDTVQCNSQSSSTHPGSYATSCQGASLRWQLEAERGQKWQNSKNGWKPAFLSSFHLYRILCPSALGKKKKSSPFFFFHWFVGLKQQISQDALSWSALCWLHLNVSAKFKSGHKPLFSYGVVFVMSACLWI